MAQVGFVVYLVVSIGFTLLAGPSDVYALASLVFAVIFAVLVWMCWRGKPLAFLGSSALGLVLLFAIPVTFSGSDPPLVVWEASLAATILFVVVLEGIVSYAELKREKPSA